ncbi:MAG: DUF2059 domain-containing protein [Sulfitobacter sp.]|nr:DUF2059 domain-containing protein [Sulfitobacter sp.]
MRRAFKIAPLLWCLALATAQAEARMTGLVDVLGLREATQILREEGIASAAELRQEMLQGQSGPGFDSQIAALYDPNRMAEVVRQALEEVLDEAAQEEVIAFYASDLGARIISLENSARRAIAEEEVEEAARARHAELESSDDPRLAQIDALIEAGDMVTRNVTSAMNANLGFLRGMAEGGAVEMTEDEMLGQVAAELEEIQVDTEGWLNAYMLLAYSPLTEGELEAYLAFSRSDAGLALNRGLFDGFGLAYSDISFALGRIVALNMTAQEL